VITVPSKATAIDLQSIGFATEKIRIIHLGLEHETIDRSLEKPLQKMFEGIYIGRIAPNKGIFDTLHSWKSVVRGKPNGKLAIVNGKGDSRLESFINTHNLQESVVLFGRLSQFELTTVLLSSNLLIIPSYIEGFSFTVGKALLHNVPVVSYNIPVIREIYGSFSPVSLVKEGDIKALAKAIQNALSKKSQIDWDIVQKNLLETYSWRNTATTFYNLLEELH
jgi:glycosyltransferase involved in cell wall biosynthesis